MTTQYAQPTATSVRLLGKAQRQADDLLKTIAELRDHWRGDIRHGWLQADAERLHEDTVRVANQVTVGRVEDVGMIDVAKRERERRRG